MNTSSTSWQTAATLAFTSASAGDYLVIASATRASDANLGAMRCRLEDVIGGATYRDRAWSCKDDWDNQAFAAMEKLTLTAAARTLQLQYRSESGTLCYIRAPASWHCGWMPSITLTLPRPPDAKHHERR